MHSDKSMTDVTDYTFSFAFIYGGFFICGIMFIYCEEVVKQQAGMDIFIFKDSVPFLFFL